MAATTPEYQILGTDVIVDAATGSAAIVAITTTGTLRLNFSGGDLLMLRDRMAKRLAEARHAGLYMLPAAEGCHGLEASLGRSRLQIRLVLEDGSEGRLPIKSLLYTSYMPL